MSRSNPSTEDRMDPATRLQYGALDRLAGYQLRRAHTRFFANFTERLADHAITPGQLGLLLMIEGNPGISQTALARAVGIERSTLGEFIDKFQERSLVERRGSIVDRRSHALHLTATGTAFVKGVMPAVEAHEEAVMSALSPADRATLVRLLALIAGDDP
jgi:DNA-binding MarR family transcriptional regulator